MADAAEVLEDLEATLITQHTDDVDPDGSDHLEVPEPRCRESSQDLDEFLLPSYVAGSVSIAGHSNVDHNDVSCYAGFSAGQWSSMFG